MRTSPRGPSGRQRGGRRTAFLLGPILAVAGCTSRGAGGPAGKPAADAPNILVIVADDLGWRGVGYHDPELLTPNIDRLARSGVRLECHYVFPTCSPTRAGLLTGRHPSRFGILSPISGRSKLALGAGTPTLATLLKESGYATAIAGKWHLVLRPQVGPKRYGFDSTYGYLNGQLDPLTHVYKNGDRTWHRDDRYIEEPGHVTDLLVEEAVRFISVPRAEPFFLYVAFSAPHVPFVEEERWTKLYEGRIESPSRRLKAAAISHLDDGVGRIDGALERAGKRGNTLIIFLGDNGGQRGSDSAVGGYNGKYGPYPDLGDNRPLRGWKGEVHEGGIRVPAFASWPGKLEPRVAGEPVCVLDWLPTIARLAGRSPGPELRLEGVDIWPVLVGAGAPVRHLFYWRTPQATAVRAGEWKLIETGGKEPRRELYHLGRDPGEEQDLAAAEPEEVARLLAALKEQQGLDP